MYKNKKFDYDLWTTNDDGVKRYWVRIRATQEVTEVDLETIRFLRNIEKSDNRDAKLLKKTEILTDSEKMKAIILYPVHFNSESAGNDDAVPALKDAVDYEKQVLDKLLLREFVSSLTYEQRQVLIGVLLEGNSYSEYAHQNNCTKQKVYRTIKQIKEKAKKFFE